MATVPLDNPTGDALVFSTPAGLVPSVAEADPVTGLPADRATETTLAALKTVADTLATAAAAIQAAVEALDAKATAIDTGAIAGTVSLDGATLAALETVNANTGLAQPLTDAQLRAAEVPVSGPITDAQLRAAAVPVSADALPLPTGAASETTLASVDGKLPALSGGRIPVELPAGGGGLTDAELRASEVPVVDDVVANFLYQMLMILQSPAAFDLSLNRLRQTAIIESGTVTTVSTVTNCTTVGGLTSIDGRNGAMAINALDHTAWALNVGACIT